MTATFFGAILKTHDYVGTASLSLLNVLSRACYFLKYVNKTALVPVYSYIPKLSYHF